MYALICLLMLMPSQPQPRAQAFVGTWTAEFKGTTFIWLDLRMPNDALTGRISLGDLHVDGKGLVDGVGAAPADRTPIADVAVADSKLAFSRKDGDDTDRFEMRLIDDTSAELRFVLTDAQRQELSADGIHLPEPVRLKRVAR